MSSSTVRATKQDCLSKKERKRERRREGASKEGTKEGRKLYIISFELSVGCGTCFKNPGPDNIYLECSSGLVLAQ